METPLPTLEILNTQYYVDWDKKWLTQVDNPQNNFSLGKPDDDGKFRLLLDRKTKRPVSDVPIVRLLNHNIADVRLTLPYHLAEKFEPDNKAANSPLSTRNAARVLERITSALQSTTTAHRQRI